jgi:diacylglycerol kinase family enzyme
VPIDNRRPVHLVINPRSGYGGSNLLLGELRAELRAAGYTVVEHVTRYRRDAADYCRALGEEASAVVVWGGDGTVNEVASGLVGSRTAVLPCMAGTENLLAKELRIPRDPAKIVDVLESGRVVAADVGLVNGREFLLIIGVGFDGEVVRRVSSARTGHISHLSYFWPMWRTFWEHDFPLLKISADGREIFHGYGLAFVGNISRYAVGLRICRDAVIDDGLLDLVVFSCREQTALMLHAAWTLLRRHPLKGDVIYRRVREARIDSEGPAACQVDGDVGPAMPLDISLAEGRINIIVPRHEPHWYSWPWKGAR